MSVIVHHTKDRAPDNRPDESPDKKQEGKEKKAAKTDKGEERKAV